jgi:hypothetical protein
MTAKEALYRTIESLSEADARRATELVGKFHQDGLLFQAAAETGEATINWDFFFAHKLPISSPSFAFDLQIFRLSCSGAAWLVARYGAATVRDRLNVQAENALSEVSGDYFILQPDLRFLAPNWKRQPSTIENCF